MPKAKAQFTKHKVYKSDTSEKYTLVKCEHTDRSISYRLANSDGFLINDTYSFPRNFEDLISIHPDHIGSYNDMFQPSTKRSIFGNKLDEEMSKIQHSFYTLLEEIVIRI